MTSTRTHTLACILGASSASLYDLASRLSKQHGTPLPPQHTVLHLDVPLASVEDLDRVVPDLGDRFKRGERARLELKIVDLLVEVDSISIGLKMDQKQGSGRHNACAELHAALFPALPQPPSSSQIFRMYLFTRFDLCSTSGMDARFLNDSGRPDIFEVWLQMRKEGQILNGGKSISILGVSKVAIEDLVLLRKEESSAEGWTEVARVRLEMK